MNRRLFLKGISASAAIITTPGLLMPISTRLNASPIMTPTCKPDIVGIHRPIGDSVVIMNDGTGWVPVPLNDDGTFTAFYGVKYSLKGNGGIRVV